MFAHNRNILPTLLAIVFLLLPVACRQADDAPRALEVPRGYVSTFEIETGDRLLGFGPFVGYYFLPEIAGDFVRLKFVCFNERSFYTNDLAENAKLFVGEAVLAHLPDIDLELPEAARINPIFFSDAPPQWLESRPEPKDEFVHFHSCHDSRGPVLTGYWIRHKAVEVFTYDMGGRVAPGSPLFHKVTPGADKAFARIIEFDRGPE